jgi:hypothetical protein
MADKIINIEEKHVKLRKRVGTWHGSPVTLVTTHGGFNIVAVKDGDRMKTLGTGPHPGMAKLIARKLNPDLELTELSKADYEAFERNDVLVEKYIKVTQHLNDVAFSLGV